MFSIISNAKTEPHISRGFSHCEDGTAGTGCCGHIEKQRDRYLPDFARLAEAHGAIGIRVTTKKEVISALGRAFDIDAPVVIECVVNPYENVHPMVP